MSQQSASHTPGPWVPSLYGYQVLTGDSWNTICVLHEKGKDYRLASWEDGRAAGMAEANARLIAAAPDLLALAQMVVEASKLSGVNGPLADAARAAIAKAEARS